MSAAAGSARETQLADAAEALLEATRSRKPIAPLRGEIEGMTLDDAYRVQTLQLEQHLADGRVLAGRKVGLTSFAMQKQLGVDSPDFGWFFKDMVHGDGAEVPTEGLISPKVEPEFGFVLARPLSGPGVTRADALAAIGSVHAAIEIIDSRIADWDIRLVDTVADNASCGAIAVASDPLDLDWSGIQASEGSELNDVRCSLVIDGETQESGIGTDVMGDPLEPLVWLANTLGERGVSLEAGQLILPGSFTKALPVVVGQSVAAEFSGPDGRRLGSLTITFG